MRVISIQDFVNNSNDYDVANLKVSGGENTFSLFRRIP